MGSKHLPLVYFPMGPNPLFWRVSLLLSRANLNRWQFAVQSNLRGVHVRAESEGTDSNAAAAAGIKDAEASVEDFEKLAVPSLSLPV